jgi:dGTP triphosphohydrolase
VSDKLENSMTRYKNLTNYEDTMTDIRKNVQGLFDKIRNELTTAERQITDGLKGLMQSKKVTEKQKKIKRERTMEYDFVMNQIKGMKDEMTSMIDKQEYAKIFSEKGALNKFMEAIEVVNYDLQNHINENRPPVEEMICDIKDLVHKIRSRAKIQITKFLKYEHYGVPCYHNYTDFSLFFKKFKKKIIENDKELSLLDAGIY